MSSVYIHIPYCISKCDYCDFFSVPCSKNLVPDEYVSSLCFEIEFFKDLISPIETLYIGGGTPSLLSKKQLESVFCALNKAGFEKNPEITYELNPSDVTEDYLLSLEKIGITRLSLGLQSLSEKALSFVHRRSSLSDVKKSLEIVQKIWKKSFSVDLISSLPFESEQEFLSSLKELLFYNPSHISLYSLCVEEETVLGKKINSGKIKYDFDLSDKIWLSGKDFLVENGFIHYEVSNFYRKENGFPCRHNLSYWSLKDYFGFGSGATGSFFGKNGFRYTNTKDISQYINFWLKNEKPVLKKENLKEIFKNFIPCDFENLPLKTQVFEFFMMSLRTLDGVNLSELKKRFSYLITEKILNLFDRWISLKNARKYFKDGNEFFALTEQGILFENKFLEEFLEVF